MVTCPESHRRSGVEPSEVFHFRAATFGEPRPWREELTQVQYPLPLGRGTFILLIGTEAVRKINIMPIPLGIIGCGTHAQHHAEHYKEHFFTLNAWDPDVSAAEKIPSAKKAKTCEELLADKEVQAVLISSPDKFHLTQIEMALAAGKHVFCEKPLLVPGEELCRLENAFALAHENGLVLTTCHPRRYDKPALWLLEKLRAEHAGLRQRFGAVLGFAFDFSYHKPSKDWKHGRSLLLDHINHEIDLMNFLFGVKGFDAWKLHDSFDHYEVVGRRDDDITFRLQGTRRLNVKKYPEWCRVRFERGEVSLDMMLGIAYLIDHDRMATKVISEIVTDYDGRLERVMGDFAGQIHKTSLGYLSVPEMMMNTEAGITLQQNGIQHICVRY